MNWFGVLVVLLSEFEDSVLTLLNMSSSDWSVDKEMTDVWLFVWEIEVVDNAITDFWLSVYSVEEHNSWDCDDCTECEKGVWFWDILFSVGLLVPLTLWSTHELLFPLMFWSAVDDLSKNCECASSRFISFYFWISCLSSGNKHYFAEIIQMVLHINFTVSNIQLGWIFYLIMVKLFFLSIEMWNHLS